MAVSLAQVYAKAKAYVDALCKLPRSEYSQAPSGHYGRDYNMLRKFAIEVLPELDEKLLGRYLAVRTVEGASEICDARFVEIETYTRQILEQLTIAVAQAGPKLHDPAVLAQPDAAAPKSYDVQTIRQEYSQAYAPWTDQDDAYLRTRFSEGATVNDLASEFGRKPGAIRSRLRKLGLEA